MPEYRRSRVPGGVYFLTLVTRNRERQLVAPAVLDALRTSWHRVVRARPAYAVALVVLPDHLHCVLHLPLGDSDYSTRIRLLKRGVTLELGGDSIWQRRFWERTVRDEDELERFVQYIYYNPVRHGWVACPHAWPHSSFHRDVRRGRFDRTWACQCCHGRVGPPDFAGIEDLVGE